VTTEHRRKPDGKAFAQAAEMQRRRKPLRWVLMVLHRKSRSPRTGKGRAMGLHRIVAALVGLVVAIALASPAQAQRRAPADIQADFDQFIIGFRTAVRANDAAAVAALTKFPFFWQDLHDAASFQKTTYARLFTQKVRACIARERGVYDRDQEGNHNFLIFCGQQIFLFTRTPAGFRFTEVGAND
jgi:hypothetical protein